MATIISAFKDTSALKIAATLQAALRTASALNFRLGRRRGSAGVNRELYNVVTESQAMVKPCYSK